MEVTETNPFYRIRALLLEKYGERNFFVGCQLAANFITSYSKRYTTSQEVRLMCEISEADLISDNIKIALALRGFFYQNSVADLFTLPETMPESFIESEIVIVAMINGVENYISRAVMNGDKTRTPHLTMDVGKAQKFDSRHAAERIISKFPEDGKTYTATPFAHVATKPKVHEEA